MAVSVKSNKSARLSEVKIFYSFIRQEICWIVLIVVCNLIMSTLMVFYDVAVGDMVYGWVISAFLLVAVAAVRWLIYRKKCRGLREMSYMANISLEGMEQAKDVLEEEYQNIMEIIFQDRAEKMAEAERKGEDLREYYAMWVHQIKTPISALRLLLDEKSRCMDMSEEKSELFEIEQYVEMALNYMRLGSESTDFVFQQVQIDDVVKAEIRKYAGLFVRKKLRLDYSGVDLSVVTDAKWMGFVTGQILSNAIKYTPAYKEKRDTENGGVISIYREGDSTLVIEDNGMGIRAEDLPRVCEKGYTGYNGHADRHSTGIGLYLCSSVMKMLSHKMIIESEEGVGTKVKLVFEQNRQDD